MNLITRIRKSYITKGVAMLLAFNMVAEIIWPTAALALTSGPSQPEVQSFEPVETTDMVNLFTGDFGYNIPLMYLPGPNGGYPINLAYHGNVTMDQEASWVGLGWNINAGAINRAVRGNPDDFKGDNVTVTQDIKDNWTVGLGVNSCLEVFGADGCQGNATDLGLSLGLNFHFNSYQGFGYTLNAGVTAGGCPDYQIGLSLDPDDGIGANANVSFESNVSRGASYSVSSYAGIGFNSKRGLDLSTGNNIRKIMSHMEKESYQAINMYMDSEGNKKTTLTPAVREREVLDVNYSVARGSFISFSEGSHSMVNSLPMNTYRLNVNIGAGFASTQGVFAKASFSGNFDIQTLRDKGEPVSQLAWGYEGMRDDNDFVDFSRSNDGPVMKTSSNLATPQITYDYYMIQGQGIGGSFRPYRAETGRVFDPLAESNVEGGYFNMDAGGFKAGWGGGATVGHSRQDKWLSNHNNNGAGLAFSSTLDLWAEQDATSRTKEEVYYKSHGELTSIPASELNHIAGEAPVRGEISGNGVVGNYKVDIPAELTNERDQTNRVARNNLIHKLTNEEINSFHASTSDLTTGYANGDDFMHEYEIFYYDWPTMNASATSQSVDPANYLNRRTRNSKDINHHNAGYKVLDESGSYYVYGLPVYNTKQVEAVFTVNAAETLPSGSAIFEAHEMNIPLQLDGNGKVDYKAANTHQYFQQRETPPYAHSYLLTSILGADYVDVDNNGPSENDKGYWVKFDYVKYAGNYKWRAPFTGCMYSPGSPTTLEDDKGSYQYGEKEVYYLSRMETATHIVIFDLSARLDQFEAEKEMNEKTGTVGEYIGDFSGLKIDKIDLYEKEGYLADPANAVAIQTVHFEYDYSLCPNTENNNQSLVTENTNKGKLTLKKVWFTYEGNERGALNPYVFEYSTFNPDYSVENYDRWGNYKNLHDISSPGDALLSRDINQVLPYTDQYHQGFLATTDFASTADIPENQAKKDEFQTLKDQYTSAWCLEKITLPSGGEIQVQYESDDYAYVQSERATQMMYITEVNDNAELNRLYFPGTANNNFENDPTQRRIYFKLEQPVQVGLTNQQYADRVYSDYVRDIVQDEGGKRNLYFRNWTNLKGNFWDFVSGYVPLEDDLSGLYGVTTVWHYGVSSATTTIDGNSCHTEGFVTIECARDKQGNCYNEYHPMALAAWQHIRTNCPEILSDMGAFNTDDIANLDTDHKKAKKVKNLFAWIPELHQMFTGYRMYCFQKELGMSIDFKKSMIRLTSPDRKKFGGGNRVKQIALSDNWSTFESTENNESYGLKYDYTTSEIVNGAEVVYSSGVAQYEPMIGADEIALRYPKFYPGNIPFKTPNNLFFEHPVNEAYMPAPVVGYSKVTVASLNTAEQVRKAESPTESPDPGRGTTGVTEYEFYTAKDFPVMVAETEISLKHFNVPIMIPFIATYNRNKIGASQGYKIELNDMHGKLRSVAQYGLDKEYYVTADPLTKTTYKYNSIPVMYHGKPVFKLNNEVNTLTVDQTTRSYQQEVRLVGVEYEFFTDQRHNKNWSMTIGFNANIDGVFFGTIIPVPSFWGTIGSNKSDVRTYVTNKIIHKSGLLTEVENVNEHYVSKSQTVLFDRETGRPVLTKQQNEFNDEVYNLSHSAHWEYDGMGQAYKNINMEFFAELDVVSSTEKLFSGDVPVEILGELVPGDELIARVSNYGSASTDRNFKATFISENHGTGGGNAVFYIENFSKGEPHGEGIPLPHLAAWFKIYRSGRRNHYMAEAGNTTFLMPGTNSVLLEDPAAPINEGSVITRSSTAVPHATAFGYNLNFFDRSMSNVISASAATFRDNWETENKVEFDHENPYMTGEAGIWRAHKQYAYIDTRTQDKNPANGGIDPQTDGVMNNVPLFNWQVQDFEQFESKWHYSGEVTRYNDFGYETENRDRLGVYSSALYGYNKAFVIGIGGNASYYEMGVEDFERFTIESVNETDDIEGKMDAESNLNFYETRSSSETDVYTTDNYRILGGDILTANSYVIIDKPFLTGDLTDYWNPNPNVDMALISTSSNGKQQYRLFRVALTGATSYDSGTKTRLQFEAGPQTTAAGGAGIMYLAATDKVNGRVTVYKKRTLTNVLNEDTDLDFVNTTAHSGKQAAKITGGASFIHQSLRLEEGKNYLFSCWVKRDNTHVTSFLSTPASPNWDIEIEGQDVTNPATWNYISTQAKLGRIINGWQKVDIEFTPEYDGQLVRTTFTAFAYVSTALYVDDVRIAPKTGGMVSYVYDPENFRLKATLNANNYTTYYFYDEQGRLHLTKQETEEGVFTISETRGYAKPTAAP